MASQSTQETSYLKISGVEDLAIAKLKDSCVSHIISIHP